MLDSGDGFNGFGRMVGNGGERAIRLLELKFIRQVEKNGRYVIELSNFLHLCCMGREIIAHKHYFKEFLESLDEGTQEKVLYVLMLLGTQDRMPVKCMKQLKD